MKVDRQKILKRKVKEFLDSHPDMPISPAKIEYSMYLYDGRVQDALNTVVEELGGFTEEQKRQYAVIETISGPEDIEKWMRRKLNSSANRQLLRDKMLEHEDELEAAIKRRSLRNRTDEFTENALYFFLHSRKNQSRWILENLDNFNSPYMRSSLALVIGFRGDLKDIGRMMEEADYFDRLYPEESFDQGPILAVQELAVRFLNRSRTL